MQETSKTKFTVKWYWVVITILIVLLFILSIYLLKTNTTSNGVGKAGISLQEFEQIENGMSEMSVYNIIDSDNLLDNDEIYDKCVQEISSTKSNHIYTYTYRYQGEKNGYAEITYTADYSDGSFFVTPTVTSKQNFNLK